ncbi:MAG: cobyric acid synthase [Proteobacteria bacterium]|nr:cobyric acid synthase [Desulfobulbaceae bacterium]MBU4154255.1 cobyric acid synthase [Pseudomonadota bacterium]
MNLIPHLASAAPFTHGGNLRKLAASSGRKMSELLDFSASINPLGPPEYLRPLISRNLEALLHYPDPDYDELRQSAAVRFAVDPSQIIVGNGSTEIIHALPAALGVARAVIPGPSYLGYHEAFAAISGQVHYLSLSSKSNFAIDWHALTEELTGGEVLFLGQPNNPTGRCFELSQLEEVMARHPATFFVVDEAFLDFVVDQPSALSLLSQYQNLVVLRSLTKFYAVPGLRLGLAFAGAGLAAQIRAKLPPWSVNSLALAFGTKVLLDDGYARQSQEVVSRLRQELADGLAALPEIKVFPGQANYLLCQWLTLPAGFRTGSEVYAALLAQGVAVRDCANFTGLSADFFRVAVRSAEENAVLLDALGAMSATKRVVSRRRRTPALMVQGTSSDAGKSVITAALCRILLQDGVRVAPFKSQNMSLNSFVTRDGGEMGRAQVVQAQACRLDPDTRMNPVLLKPVSHVGSQVIINGRSVGTKSVEEYVAYKPHAFSAACAAYDSLASEMDAIILEGAGSPAEVNLKRHDIVNMPMARYAKAPVVLVGDIDRGGVFASFVGTMEVMAEWERALVAGFVVNRFRGRESLLDPAFEIVKKHTGRSVLGVIPNLSDLGLPEEDSVSFKKGLFNRPKPTSAESVEIVLVDLPHISNFTDFEPFLLEPDVWLRVVRTGDELGDPAAVLLPGSKNVIEDLRYLNESGFSEGIRRLAARGETEIVGLCGGFQMLGDAISDPHGIEASGTLAGLGLLPISTVLDQDKTLTRQSLTHRASGFTVHGYEIHHGRTESGVALDPVLTDGPPGVAAGKGLIWGTYLHGLYDADAFRHWFIEGLRQRRGLAMWQGKRGCYNLEPALDRLAATVRERLDMSVIYRLMGL